MRITVVAAGKIKERFYRAAIEEYAKRLSRYCRLEILEVADEKTPDGAGPALEAQIKEKEGKRILPQTQDGAHVIALSIGGSLGLSEQVQKRADEQLSFSKMTFPHQLMQVILLEQVYR